METFRIVQDAALYYLTFSVIEWLPIFVNEEACLIIADSLNYCHHNKGLRTNAFVIMPTHMHLIGTDVELNMQRFQQTIADMRRHTGKMLANYCEQRMPAAFAHVLRQTGRADRERQFWQQSRHPEAIYTQEFWHTKLDYLHDNPRRKGLVREPSHWRFSSAAHWLQDPPGESEVILTAPEW